MNVVQALQSLSGYPIPHSSIENIVEEVGLDCSDEVTQEYRQRSAFKRAKARIYLFLSEAPNVSQAGISYNFSSDERARYARKAEQLLKETDDPESSAIDYGYQGEDL